MVIEPIGRQPQWAATIAQWQFAQWQRLTGFATEVEYAAFLNACCQSAELPCVLVAHEAGRLLGSVNIVDCDMAIRPELRPWLGQLFVAEEQRGAGVGAALVEAASQWARQRGFARLYLYTSGTLPRYYTRLGFAECEQVDYLGGARTLMAVDLTA